MKKWITCLLLVLPAAATVFATGSGEAGSGQGAEGAEISVLYPEVYGSPVTSDMLYFSAIQERLGITIEPVSVPMTGMAEKINALIATREIPDIMHLRTVRQIADEYGPQGAFIDLEPYLDGPLAAAKASYEWYPEERALDATMRSPDGKIYGLPINLDFVSGGQFFLLNPGMMQELGVDPPETFDEFKAQLAASKRLYPENVGLTSPDGPRILSGMASWFDSTNGIAFDPDSETYYDGRLTQGYRDMLAFLADLYAEGLLDPDITFVTRDIFTSNLTTGNMYAYVGYASWADNNPQTPMQAVMHPAYRGEVRPVDVTNHIYPSMVWVVSSETENRDAAFEYLNYLYTDEGATLTTFGVEGVTYEMIDGEPHFTDNIITPKNPDAEDNISEYGFRHHGMYGWAKHTPDFLGPNLIWTDTNITQAGLTRPPMPPLSFDSDAADTLSDLETALNTFLEENAWQLILGDISLADWDEAVQRASDDLGVDTILDIYNETYAETYK